MHLIIFHGLYQPFHLDVANDFALAQNLHKQNFINCKLNEEYDKLLWQKAMFAINRDFVANFPIDKFAKIPCVAVM